MRNKSFNDGFLEDDSGYKGAEEKCAEVLEEDSILKPAFMSINDGFHHEDSKSLNEAFIQDDSGYRSPEHSPEEFSSLLMTPMRKIRFSLQATPGTSPVLRSRRVQEERLDVLVSMVPSIVTMILVSAILYMTFTSGGGNTQRFGNMK